MKFNIGDKVLFLNEKGGGTIIGFVNKKMANVLMDDDIEIPYPIDQLVLFKSPVEIKKENKENNNAEKEKPINQAEWAKLLKAKKPDKRANKARSKKHITRTGELEIEVDLHIEELIDNYIGMNNAEIIQFQINHFQNKLEEAVSGNLNKVIFIHGVGNGRLKNEIRKILRTKEGINFYDAPYSKYGWGATEVLIY